MARARLIRARSQHTVEELWRSVGRHLHVRTSARLRVTAEGYPCSSSKGRKRAKRGTAFVQLTHSPCPCDVQGEINFPEASVNSIVLLFNVSGCIHKITITQTFLHLCQTQNGKGPRDVSLLKTELLMDIKKKKAIILMRSCANGFIGQTNQTSFYILIQLDYCVTQSQLIILENEYFHALVNHPHVVYSIF